MPSAEEIHRHAFDAFDNNMDKFVKRLMKQLFDGLRTNFVNMDYFCYENLLYKVVHI